MMNFRLVVNGTKDGSSFGLTDVKIQTEDSINGRQAMGLQVVEATYNDVDLLFQAIKQHVINVVQSGIA